MGVGLSERTERQTNTLFNVEDLLHPAFASLRCVGSLRFAVSWRTDRLFPVKRRLVRAGFVLGSLLQPPP